MALKKVGYEDYFYMSIRDMLKKLAMLCREYESYKVKEMENMPRPNLHIIDPYTGQPMPIKDKASSTKKGKSMRPRVR